MTIITDRQQQDHPCTAAGSTVPLPEEIEKLALQSLEDDKATDIVSIDLSGKTSIADYMIIATGSSARQVAAMADHLLEKLKAAGVKSVQIEGKSAADWVLLDAGDIIVHLFRPEVREFYNIEKMWLLDAPAGTARTMNTGNA